MDDPDLAERWRQMVVHQETAAALERRAEVADAPAVAASLRRRAAQRYLWAERLRRELIARTEPPSHREVVPRSVELR